MAWRNQGITGSNNIPLGRRRFGGEEGPEDESRTATPASMPGAGDSAYKRGRSPVRAEPPADGVKKRKKRNRWGDAQENKAAGLMGLPTMIMANFTNEQLEAYTLHLRIEEISQKLRINDVVPADGDRSPSPPPQYDNFGRRVNTREYRYRKRLEDERHKLVEKAMKTIPNYHPPSDYRRPTKTQEKVYVPVNDYPEINFSMITNPLTPNHCCICTLLHSLTMLCSSRASDEDFAAGRCLSPARFLRTLALPVLPLAPFCSHSPA
jgi:splicing factor 1